MAPFFSIITPVYNVEKYLAECVESVLAQSITDYELLLVDDGSTDNSGRICDEYSQRDHRIKTYHQMNSGILGARQYGLSQASGRYILSLDSDDYFEPNAFERIKQAIDDSGADCVIYGVNRVSDGVILHSTRQDFSEKIINNKSELYKKVFFDSDYNSLCRKAVNANVMSSMQNVEDSTVVYGEDLLQSIAIYKNAASVLFIPDCLYNYRMNPDSVTHALRVDRFNWEQKARATAYAFLQQENVLSAEEMRSLSRFYRNLLINNILQIARIDASHDEKIALLRKMRSTKYCEEIISASGKWAAKPSLKLVIWKLFVHKMLGCLALILSAYPIIRPLKVK